ncbi:NACHT domain-containing protein [Williamsia soli]|uniref:NACHT domain-containing protein n=1 Tax=Williamsia soli TaxID=364929 RepID=UPI001A9D8770|nr:NACHT domain-containing protein [Williamsia soli]
MEPIALALGSTATKWVFRMWMKDELLADLSGDLVDVVRGRIGDVMEGRRASRQFEQLAELMAQRLQPFIDSEFQSADRGERSAAAIAVDKTLEISLLANLDPISVDLDATLLEQVIRSNHPRGASEALLGDSGTALYDLLLTECCSYIVAAWGRLPDFGSRAAREMLARSTRLLEIGEAVLDRLPKTLPDSWGRGSVDEIFASRYLKAVVQKNDKLQIYGVRDSDYQAAYSLSVAYISLSATMPMKPSQSRMASKAVSGPNPDDDSSQQRDSSRHDEDGLRVESALTGHPRLILGGNAGSGKTTLLQWIAVTASQSRFSDELAGWNSSIPFLLPLRRFALGELPRPEEFVGVNHSPLAGVMPEGWVHRVLADGRALILIDGLDELPESQRSKARVWLLDLIDAYPGSRYIVTSRPLAISRDWAAVKDFKYSELLSMQRVDIRAFVSHWHAAAAGSVDSDEEKALVRIAENKMLAAVDDIQMVRTLCTSPLLCALICAIHRQNVNKLPENRMDLYDTALQMLVNNRDEERDIKVQSISTLSYMEKRALLSDFALWLHENGAADAELELYRHRVAGKTRQLARQSELEGGQVADLMLARSGVLRSPVEGRVDFVHRTFLEYLAAAELVDDEALGKIVEHAHLDHWREVVIMSAGHFSSKKREELLNNLVQRGKREPIHRHRLFLLAVACLETSAVLSEKVQELLGTCLDEVVPPANMTDAASVASAGALAVPRLKIENGRATTVAACIRALSLIGTDDALEVLKTYRRDRRVTVTRQLIRAWGQFNSETYAREVLADSTLDRGFIRLTDPDTVQFLSSMQHAKAVMLDFPGKFDDLASIPASDAAWGLDVSWATKLDDLVDIKKFPNLARLWMSNSSVRSLSGLSACEKLEILYLSQCSALSNIDDLADFERFELINLYNTAIRDLGPLGGVEVKSLTVGGPHLEHVGADLKVQELSLTVSPKLVDLTRLSGVADMRTLRIVVLGDNDDSGELSLGLPTGLERLSISSYISAGRSVRLSGGDNVESLFISAPVKSLPVMPKLRTLALSTSGNPSWPDLSATDWGLFPELVRVDIAGPGASSCVIPGFSRKEDLRFSEFSASFTRTEA